MTGCTINHKKGMTGFVIYRLCKEGVCCTQMHEKKGTINTEGNSHHGIGIFCISLRRIKMNVKIKDDFIN
jgi:hypothetical protein